MLQKKILMIRGFNQNDDNSQAPAIDNKLLRRGTLLGSTIPTLEISNAVEQSDNVRIRSSRIKTARLQSAVTSKGILNGKDSKPVVMNSVATL